MKKILIDTNIILDIALDRKPFVKKSIEFIRLIAKNNIEAFVTATTVTDIYYVTHKKNRPYQDNRIFEESLYVYKDCRSRFRFNFKCS